MFETVRQMVYIYIAREEGSLDGGVLKFNWGRVLELPRNDAPASALWAGQVRDLKNPRSTRNHVVVATAPYTPLGPRPLCQWSASQGCVPTWPPLAVQRSLPDARIWTRFHIRAKLPFYPSPFLG